jgi:hypothetical protein
VALKVQAPINKKKHRTLVKTDIVGVLDAMQEEGMEAILCMGKARTQDSMEEDGTTDVNLPISGPNHLTSTLDKAHQEQ